MRDELMTVGIIERRVSGRSDQLINFFRVAFLHVKNEWMNE